MKMRKIFHNVRICLQFWREQGLIALIKMIYHKFHRISQPLSKINIVDRYSFLLQAPIGEPLAKNVVATNTINWFIPPIGRGSGGHLNIFRFIYNLEQQGFQCNVVIIGAPESLDDNLMNKLIAEWYFPVKAKVYWGVENAPAAHISMATAWATAYALRSFQSTNLKCYFVQDFEPWFFASGAEYAFAEETYRFGFTGITAGGWLAGKLADEYGMETYSVGFSYDRGRYCYIEREYSGDRKVFFYARPNTERRAFEMGVLALNEVANKFPDIEVVFAGGDISSYDIPFKHVDLGIANIDLLPELYNQCSVSLVLSFSNLSLLPLELMACGVPVVSNRGPWSEWLLNEENSRLANPTIESLVDGLSAVLEDKVEAERLRESGLKTAAATDWRTEAKRFAEIIKALDVQAAG